MAKIAKIYFFVAKTWSKFNSHPMNLNSCNFIANLSFHPYVVEEIAYIAKLMPPTPRINLKVMLLGTGLDAMVVSVFHQKATGQGFESRINHYTKKKKRVKNCLSISSPNSAKVRALWIRLLSSYKLMCQLSRTNNIIKSIHYILYVTLITLIID